MSRWVTSLALLSGGWVSASSARADILWTGADASLPPWVVSARILKREQLLMATPSSTAARRGAAIRGTLLPVYASRRGPGCAGNFLSVGPSAWVCDDAVELSGKAPIDPLVRALAGSPDGLPFRYYFVGSDGSLAYDRLELADLGEPTMRLEPGFAVAIVQERVVDGARYGNTHHGLWVPMRDLGAVAAFPFRGAELQPGAQSIAVAWIVADKAAVHTKPSRTSAVSRTLRRLDPVTVHEETSSLTGAWSRVGDDAWVASRDLARPSISDPPVEAAVDAGERWIDVDLATQTLVAYEGRTPVFATVVSTGRGRHGSATATPVGTHRIWVKLLSSDMDNLEDDAASRYYRIEDVPWVQYFSKGVGLHGAFWHRSFGRVRSHGCVNLAPLDAERLFYWTGPHLPAGWSAVHPAPHDLGTIVRVR
jgi:lipoprotein-anchoring transpeptidase ErfK/SrfK